MHRLVYMHNEELHTRLINRFNEQLNSPANQIEAFFYKKLSLGITAENPGVPEISAFRVLLFFPVPVPGFTHTQN